MIRIIAHIDGAAPIKLDGATVASAARKAAAHFAGGLPGKSLGSQPTGIDRWTWRWSRLAAPLYIRRIPPSQSYASRAASGRRALNCQISAEAGDALERLAERAGSKTVAVERAILAADRAGEKST